jgi:hypothetical protein
MKQELKEKWIAALRSGKYKQGQGLLRSANDRYCCLGVLCEVAGVPAKQVSYEDARWRGIPQDQMGCYDYDNECGFLSSRLRVNLGVDPDVAYQLATMNDAGESFKSLAKYIENRV